MTEQAVSATFGERLRRRRMALGLSQRVFAERVGIPGARLSHYEKGDVQAIALARLVQLAKALGTTTDYLLGLSDDPGPVTERPCPEAGLTHARSILPPVSAPRVVGGPVAPV